MPLLHPDLDIVDMGCGLNPFANLPCHVIGLDRHELPGQIKGKMEAPPLPNASADVLIYSLSLYGTTKDLRDYFTQARRSCVAADTSLLWNQDHHFPTRELFISLMTCNSSVLSR